MKVKLLFLSATALMAAGCLQFREQIGASAGTDYNVLTGGPVRGTTLADLPEAALQAIRERAPRDEVADIDKTARDGTVIYIVSFAEPGVNPKIFVTEDGRWVSDVHDLDQITNAGAAGNASIAQRD